MVIDTIVSLLMLVFISPASFPEGWDIPKDSEFYLEWRDRSPTKYLSCQADFNGDGITDTAFILESDKDKNFGIFVELSNYKEQSICLFDAAKDINEALAKRPPNIVEMSQNPDPLNSMLRLYRLYHGIEIIQPGKYPTACGKGFWDCRRDEPEEIDFKYPGIQFFMDDAGFRVFYFWDVEKKMFKDIQVGD